MEILSLFAVIRSAHLSFSWVSGAMPSEVWLSRPNSGIQEHLTRSRRSDSILEPRLDLHTGKSYWNSPALPFSLKIESPSSQDSSQLFELGYLLFFLADLC